MAPHPTAAPRSSQATAASPGRPPGSEGYSARDLRRLLGWIALLALTTNLLYFSHFQDSYSPDSATYITPAGNLVRGHGFTTSEHQPETVRTPGYPLLIVPFLWAGLDLRYLVLFQHLLLVLLTVATAAAAFQLSGSRRQALLVGALLSIDLPMLDAANMVLAETLFTVIFAGMLWLLWTASKPRDGAGTGRLFLSGLLGGAAVLIRPIALYFFLPAAIYLLLASKHFRLKAVLVFVVAFACFPFLWAERNHRETGYFTVSSISGWEMLCCRAAGVLALDDPGDFANNVLRHRAQLIATACQDMKARYGRDCAELSPPQKSQYYMQVSRKILLQHPWGYIRLALRGAAVLILDGGPSSLEGLTGISPHLGIRLLLIYTVPAFVFAVVGLWGWWETNRPLFYLAFLTIAYYVAVSAGAESYSRYRVPFIPLYVILTAAGIDMVLQFLRRKPAS